MDAEETETSASAAAAAAARATLPNPPAEGTPPHHPCTTQADAAPSEANPTPQVTPAEADRLSALTSFL